MRSASSPAETRLDVRRLLALGTFDDLKRHPLTFLEALEPLHFNGGKMREKLLTAFVGRNEPKALDVVKPLDNSLCHIFPLCLFHFVRVFASALGLEQVAATQSPLFNNQHYANLPLSSS